ncbi:hypothetical protein GCM10009609_25430 [Pseudonocardia aurantiaca]
MTPATGAPSSWAGRRSSRDEPAQPRQDVERRLEVARDLQDEVAHPELGHPLHVLRPLGARAPEQGAARTGVRIDPAAGELVDRREPPGQQPGGCRSACSALVPSRTRVVSAARWARTSSGSNTQAYPSAGSSTGTGTPGITTPRRGRSQRSITHTESRPAASAPVASRTRSSVITVRPPLGRPTPISMP